MSEDIVELYRRVFNTPDGKKVALDLLVRLQYFDTVSTSPADLVLRNFANEFLRLCGIINPTDPTNLQRLVDTIFNMQYLGERDGNKRPGR